MTSTWLSEPVFHPGLEEVEGPEFVERLRRRDCEAFQEMVERYGQVLYNTVLRITGSPADAEDALQNTYLSAYEHIESFEGRSSLKTWLTRICINAALTGLRKKNRHQAYSLEEPATAGEHQIPRWVTDPGPDPEQKAGGAEFRRLLSRYLRMLSPALRHVFVLRDLEELSGEETADALGITVAAVKTRLSRARAALRRYLEPHLSRPGLRRRSVRQTKPQGRQAFRRELLGAQAQFRQAREAVYA